MALGGCKYSVGLVYTPNNGASQAEVISTSIYFFCQDRREHAALTASAQTWSYRPGWTVDRPYHLRKLFAGWLDKDDFRNVGNSSEKLAG